MKQFIPLSRWRCPPRWVQVGVLALVPLVPVAAHACTMTYPGESANLTVDAWDDPTAGHLISNWRNVGNVSFLWGCPGGVIPVEARASMPGLEFVRSVSVDGVSYPAFGLRGQPQSPLLIFRHTAASGSAGQPSRTQPFDIRSGSAIGDLNITTNTRWSSVSIAAVSRGGEMRAVPDLSLGTVTHTAPLYPHLVKTDTYRFTANLRTKTCSINATTVSLQDVSVSDLAAADRTAGERAFNVVMNCNGEFPVTMKLTDANAPGNTGSRLTPTSNATATGVRVQLLRAGNPVVLDQAWSIAQSQNGNQDIALSARYYREAGAFQSGVVEGQAVLTAEYR